MQLPSTKIQNHDTAAEKKYYKNNMVNFERIIDLLPQSAGKNQICNALTDVDVASTFRDKTFNSLLFFVIQIRNRTTLLLRI